MKPRKKELYFVASVLAATLIGGAYFGYLQRGARPSGVEAHIGAWSESPKLMAQLLVERYGAPDEMSSQAVTWRARGPWKRVSVRNDARSNYLEQAVSYRAGAAAAAKVREFGHGVLYDPAEEELSAASNRESLNYLALNMADEAASGKRSPRQAAEFYLWTGRLAASGKSSPYLERLMFVPHRPMPLRR